MPRPEMFEQHKNGLGDNATTVNHQTKEKQENHSNKKETKLHSNSSKWGYTVTPTKSIQATGLKQEAR